MTTWQQTFYKMKIVEANSRNWKVQFLFLRSFLLVLIKPSFREENRALDCDSMKLWDFADIS